MYFGKFYPLELLTNKRFSGRTIRFWYGFYMKHNQKKIIFLQSYNSSSFDDMEFLAYDVSRHYMTSVKMTSSPLQKFWHPF